MVNEETQQSKSIAQKIQSGFKKADKLLAPEKKLNVNVQTRFNPAPMLSRQQAILKDMFGGGERNWGTGRNLPVINNDLNNPQGGGIIKSRDGGRTGGFFGMR
jgi:hypothetical protein